METNKVLEIKGTMYGDSCEFTNNFLRGHMWRFKTIIDVGFFFQWLMIFNKLIRALTSPSETDHWQDIIGYATLVLQAIEEEEAHEYVPG